jgi:arginine decarboxylase
LEKEDYYLGFFLVGAYQEILGMKHNLFSYVNEAIVNFDSDGNYVIEYLEPTQKIREILIDLDYDIDEVERLLKTNIENAIEDEDERKEILGELFLLLNDMVYLKND